MTHRKSLPPAARRFKLLPLAAATALTASSAFAQQAPPKADDGKVETVVITATKRIQPLQATPIAVSVISGNALEESNLNNLEAVIAQVPTVNFRTNASNKDAALFIRGVGTISTSPGVEPTVSTVLDGVVTARPGQATLDLVEIDRIEILRGPQGHAVWQERVGRRHQHHHACAGQGLCRLRRPVAVPGQRKAHPPGRIG